MAIGIGKEVVVQEYGPEHEGELAGWVYTREAAVSTVLQVAYARIDDGGARFTYIDHDGDRLTHNNSVNGFLPGVELSLLADESSARNIITSKGQSELVNGHRWSSTRREESFGDSFYSDERPEVDRGTWVLGEAEILGAIKAELTRINKVEYYSQVYYTLAALASADLQLADPSMHSRTELELEYAEDYMMQLMNARLLDSEMRNNLTVFGEVDAADIPEVFTNSRRAVATIEQGLVRGRSRLAMGSVYLPIGWRPGGRTWPYMDPTEKDEGKAFGVELAALQGKNMRKADYQLGTEITELNGRIENAAQVRNQLTSLALKEAQLAGQE